MGRPWIFREIAHYLETGERLAGPGLAEIHQVLRLHLQDLYRFYGDVLGVRIARKHIAWYTKELAGSAQFRSNMNRMESVPEQLAAVDRYFQQLATTDQRVTEMGEARAA